MTLRLKGENSGDVSLKAPATAGNNTITLPTSNGSAEQFLKNSGTAGELEFSSMIENSTGVGIDVSSPQADFHIGNADGASRDIVMHVQNNGNARLRFREGSTITSGYNEYSIGMAGSDDSLTFEIQGQGRVAQFDGGGRLLLGTGADGAMTTSGGANLQVRATSEAAQIILGRNDSTATSGETLGMLKWMGNDGGSYQECAAITAVVDADHANNDKPTRLAFFVTADNESSLNERIRVKSDGNTLMRSSTSNGVLNLNSAQSASESSNALVVQHTATSITGGTASCIIFTNGNIKNSNNFYGSLSDAKLKENIVDASSQWDDIKAIQVRNYNFKESTGQQTHRQLGVVAQELEAVSPGLVSDSPDRDEEGNDLGTVTKSVNYSVLYMKAVKALQEAQTRIETLETQNTAQQTQIDDLLARVTALEAA